MADQNRNQQTENVPSGQQSSRDTQQSHPDPQGTPNRQTAQGNQGNQDWSPDEESTTPGSQRERSNREQPSTAHDRSDSSRRDMSDSEDVENPDELDTETNTDLEDEEIEGSNR